MNDAQAKERALRFHAALDAIEEAIERYLPLGADLAGGRQAARDGLAVVRATTAYSHVNASVIYRLSEAAARERAARNFSGANTIDAIIAAWDACSGRVRSLDPRRIEDHLASALANESQSNISGWLGPVGV